MNETIVLDEAHLCAALELPRSTDFSKARIAADTPQSLRDLVHYALLWGVPDDGYRADLIQRASPEARANLKAIVTERDDQLDEWLAGAEAEGPAFTDAYLAFSSMRMASDEID
jgi:hypothetical protein